MRRLWLASRSPRRRELLLDAGVAFEIVDPEVAEDVDAALSADEVVRLLARRKAEMAGSRLRGGVVLAADTVVAVGERILGKPADREESHRMLQALSGTTHRVLTGVCMLDLDTGEVDEATGVTKVTMRPLSEDEIRDYVASGEGDDKAGAYAIQDRGDRFVTGIEGSWSNVVGLPIEIVIGALRRLGVIA